MTSYIVGTRDTTEKYRAVRVTAKNKFEAGQIAINRSADLGLYVRTISVKPVSA